VRVILFSYTWMAARAEESPLTRIRQLLIGCEESRVLQNLKTSFIGGVSDRVANSTRLRFRQFPDAPQEGFHERTPLSYGCMVIAGSKEPLAAVKVIQKYL
jgi:hypothetical protein